MQSFSLTTQEMVAMLTGPSAFHMDTTIVHAVGGTSAFLVLHTTTVCHAFMCQKVAAQKMKHRQSNIANS